MAGKRLIDAAKFLNASTSVAKQHLLQRQQQWDVYNRTSSLAKAVKSQTDRVTVTAQAVLQLAKRLNESGPSWRQEESKTTEAARHGEPVTLQYAAKEDVDNRRRAGPSSTPEMHVSPDTRTGLTGGTTPDQVEHLSAGGQDTFTQRQEFNHPGLSSPIRSQLPKHVLETSDVEKPSSTASLNQDVYPGPSQISKDMISDGIDINILSTPRVSQMLGKKGSALKNPYTKKQRLPPQPLPEMKAAQERWQKERAKNATASIRSKEETDAQKSPATTSEDTEVYAQPYFAANKY